MGSPYARNKTFEAFRDAALTASANGEDKRNFRSIGAVFTLVVEDPGSVVGDTLDVKIQRKDARSGEYTDIDGASFAQITGDVGAQTVDVLTVYPGVAESANETVSDVIPDTFRVVVTEGGTGTWDVTVNASLIL